jgi:hypothetical protein
MRWIGRGGPYLNSIDSSLGGCVKEYIDAESVRAVEDFVARHHANINSCEYQRGVRGNSVRRNAFCFYMDGRDIQNVL